MSSGQPGLFDPARLENTECEACGATRPAGADRAPDCLHELDFDRDYGRRPRGCLNAYDPSTAPIPY